MYPVQHAMHPLLILLLAIVAVFVLIVRLKINAFVALIAAAIVIGVLAPAVAIEDVMTEVAGRFGRVVGGIGISGAPGGTLDENCAKAAMEALYDRLEPL